MNHQCRRISSLILGVQQTRALKAGLLTYLPTHSLATLVTTYHNQLDKKLIAMLQLFVNRITCKKAVVWWFRSGDGEFWRETVLLKSSCRDCEWSIRDMISVDQVDNVVASIRPRQKIARNERLFILQDINRGCIDLSRLVANSSNSLELQNERHKLFNYYFSRTSHITYGTDFN